MTARTLVIAVLLVLAGCTTPLDPSATTPTDTPVPAAADPTTPTRTGTPTATKPATTATPSANPWGDEPIVVAIRNEGGRVRDFEPLVREAASFWEENDDAYLGFGVRYEVRPDAENPDLVVAFTDEIPDCGGVADAVGCAPDSPTPGWSTGRRRCGSKADCLTRRRRS
ncbi:hypothetical protein ACFQL0_04430 [Haloplanus litoreus]|uniref:hypothetical protein n=1 Tax=Haloplanus litoreus TaxID=767515 RepID=UPI00361BF5D9